MSQQGKITKGPHLLFVGGNGRKTYGIEITNLQPSSGYSRKWPENYHSLSKASNVMDFLGLTQNQYDSLMAELKEMEDKQL